MQNYQKTGERCYEVDWLRVYAVLLLIAIHAAAIFDPFPVTAVKGQSSLAMKIFAIFVHEWRLSVLFLISGAGAYFASGFLNSKQFVAMRFRRILIPLIVGTLVVVPIHLYLWVRGLYPGRYTSYFHFYTTMLQDAFLHGRIASKPEYLHWAHLWFLAYLFVISIVTVPLFVYLRRAHSGRAFISNLSGLCQRRGVFLPLFALPLIASELLLRMRWPGYRGPNLVNDWANFSMYLLYYVYGYLIYSDGRLRAAVKSAGTIAFFLAITTTLIFFLLIFTSAIPDPAYNLIWVPYIALRASNSWLWIVAILSFGMKHLNYKTRLLPYANEAAYPLYIIHLPILSLVAYYVVRWNAPVAAQFIAIISATLICATLIYMLVIRQTAVTRFLFGLKRKPPKVARPVGTPLDAS